MKILIISEDMPYPATDGARIRNFNMITELSKEHKITLVAIIRSEEERKYTEELRKYCRHIELVLIKRSNIKRLFDILLNLFLAKPYLYRVHNYKMVKETIDYILSGDYFDILQAEHPYTAQYILGYNLPRILDEHNIESEISRRHFIFEKNLLKKLYIFLDFLKMRRFENKICKSVDKIIVTSERDKHILKNINPNVSVIPNVIATSNFNFAINRSGEKLLFIGNFNYHANVDAVLFFYKSILTLINSKKPSVKLYIVGKNPPLRVRKLSSNDVIVTGYVEDARTYLSFANVFVVPLRVGSGTRIKILEAMASGLPVVTTSLGSEGLEVSHNENILIADEPKDFARAVLELLCNGEFARKLAINARKLVEEKYDIKLIKDKFVDIYGI